MLVIERLRLDRLSGLRVARAGLFEIALATTALLGVGQAVVARWHESLSIDEPFSANLVHLPPDQFWAAFRHDNMSLAFPLLLRGWAQLFGESELALRSLSLVLFVLAIIVLGLTARALAGDEAGIAASLLFVSSSALAIQFAATARQYMLLCLIVALAMPVFLRVINLLPGAPAGASEHKAPTAWPALGLFACLNVVGLLTHIIYIFFLGACVIAALWTGRRSFLQVAATAAVSLLVYLLIWWPVLAATLGLPTLAWMTRPDLASLWKGFLYLFGFQKTALLAVYCAALFVISYRRQLLGGKLHAVMLSILFAGLMLPFVLSQIRPVFDPSRTPVIILPAVCILCAVLMRSSGSRLLTLALVTVMLSTSVVRSVQQFVASDPYPTQMSIQSIAPQLSCGDRLIMGGLALSEVQYYLRRAGVSSCVQRATFPSDTATHPGWIDVPGLLKDPHRLSDEALVTTQRLAAEKGVRVWLFYDSRRADAAVTDLLKAELDRRLMAGEILNLRGSFFDRVFVYTTG